MAEDTKAAAYVPWGTFKNSFDKFNQGLPHRIDKTVFGTLAGGTRNEMIAALKFFSLISDDGTPTPALEKLAGLDELQRKPALKALMESAYAALLAKDLTKMTQAQFEHEMAELYWVTGSTLKKAVRFFLTAAKELGIPLSPYLKVPGVATNGAPAPRRRRTPKQKSVSDQLLPPDPPPPPASTSATMKTVRLASGGTLTLSATLDLFNLNAPDRKFVFELIDRLEEYGGGDPAEEER